MLALTVEPGVAGSLALSEVDEPPASAGPVLVESLAVGMCGTDSLILDGHVGSAPEGASRLVVGHESLGRVLEAPAGSGLDPGMLVAGMVRLPVDNPCPACAAGDSDMCVDGRFKERGIDGSHGFAAQRWRTEPEFAVPVASNLGSAGVLLEPASVVAKAWEHAVAVGHRARWAPRTVAIVGTGTIGLLAALNAHHHGFDVVAVDVLGGPRGPLVEALGGRFRGDGDVAAIAEADIVFECSGAPDAIAGCIDAAGTNAVIGLIGVPEGQAPVTIDAGRLASSLVERSGAVFGTRNANRRHWDAAAAVLAAADPGWLGGLLTRRVPIDSWRDALPRRSDDVKIVIDFEGVQA